MQIEMKIKKVLYSRKKTSDIESFVLSFDDKTGIVSLKSQNNTIK